MGGRWCQPPFTPKPSTHPSRVFKDNPYATCILKLGLMISRHDISMNQITEIISILADPGAGPSPFTDLAKQFFPRDGRDVASCVEQLQADSVIGVWFHTIFCRAHCSFFYRKGICYRCAW